jgi:hypothetical protein
MNNVQVKYEKLDPLAKKEVDDFIDFLLSKKSAKKPFDMADYKKKLLLAPTWPEEDIKELEENIKLFKSWDIEKW